MTQQEPELDGAADLRQGRSLPTPSQLPIGPSSFVNRHAGLLELTRLVVDDPSGSDRTRIVAVNGQPGVGKTALVLRWAHQHRGDFPDGTLYIDLHAYSPELAVTTESALEAFIRAFGILPESIPVELDSRSALFRSLVRDRRMLVIIDNAASSAQVRALLPASPTCPVIITSRTLLSGLAARDGATPLKLDILTPGQSVELLSRLAGEGRRLGAEDAAMLRVAELCGHLPLALRLVGERVAARPGLSFADLANEIVSEQHRLDELAVAEDELSDARAVFSWSYRSLPEDLREAFRVIGLHAGPDIGVGAMAALLNTGTRTAARSLRALAEANLVREAWSGHYRLHDLLRLYARELVLSHESQEQRTQAVRRELTWYLLTADAGRRAILPYSTSVDLAPALSLEVTSGFEDASAAMDWFLSERRNILAAARLSMETGQYDIAWKLAVVASGFLEISSYWKDWKSVQEIGLQAARLLGDRMGEALNIQILGDASWRTGDLEDARARYEEAVGLSRELGISWIEGFALRGVGLTYQDQGRIDLALPMFDSSLALFRRAGFRRGEGMSLAVIGKCALVAGDARGAVSAAEEAIVILQEIGDDWSVAWTQLDLAAALERAGREADAMGALGMAVQVFARFNDRRCEARSLVSIGQLRRRQGDLPGAQSAWRRALDLYEETGDPAAEEVWLLLEGPGEPGSA